MEYAFTLKYQLSDQDDDHDAIVERLGAEGCDDALPGVGQAGRLALAFTREAEDAEAALLSALGDVKSVIPSAILVEAAPDFVGLTDVADLLGMSRQNMRKLMLNHRASFPIPVHEGSATLWHLADILVWLQSRENYAVTAEMLDVARVTRQINLARQVGQLAPKLRRAVQQLVA